MAEKSWFFMTDLAFERRKADSKTPGILYEREKIGNLLLEKLTVTTEEGASEIDRPKGQYQTVNLPDIDTIDEEESEAGTAVLADVLEELTKEEFGKMPKGVLVVGLGNPRLSADAVGPEAVRDVIATRHLKTEYPELFESLECTQITVVCPGVSAQSGMDAKDYVGAIAKRIEPELILVIDAYAARSVERLGTTIQVSNTGIIPGGGVGNHRGEISKKTMGVPVFVIGVPTVTDSRIFIREEARKRGIEVPKWEEGEEPYFVCPKAVDRISAEAGKMISGAINRVFGIQ